MTNDTDGSLLAERTAPSQVIRAAFHTEDPLRAEEYYCTTYTDTELRFLGDQSGLAVRDEFRGFGPLGISDFGCTTGLEQRVESMGQIALARVVAGRCDRESLGESRTAGPGDALLLAQPGRPFLIRWDSAVQLQVVLFDPMVLLDVAAAPGDLVPRFTSLNTTPAGARTMNVVLDYISEHVLADELAVQHPAVLRTTARTVAAALLEAIPNTAARDPVSADRIDASRSHVLRAAVAYIHDHAHENITVAQIAGAAGVSRQAVHLAFQRHLNTTPRAYLERVRLDQAHRDFAELDPGTTSVREVALAWGFADLKQFLRTYERTYGALPESLLTPEKLRS